LRCRSQVGQADAAGVPGFGSRLGFGLCERFLPRSRWRMLHPSVNSFEYEGKARQVPLRAQSATAVARERRRRRSGASRGVVQYEPS